MRCIHVSRLCVRTVVGLSVKIIITTVVHTSGGNEGRRRLAVRIVTGDCGCKMPRPRIKGTPVGSGLIRPDAIQLPATKQLTHQSAGVAENGQIPYEIGSETVADVENRVAPIQTWDQDVRRVPL